MRQSQEMAIKLRDEVTTALGMLHSTFCSQVDHWASLNRIVQAAYEEGVAAEKARANREYFEADMLADQRKKQVILNRPSNATSRDMMIAILLAKDHEDPWNLLNEDPYK